MARAGRPVRYRIERDPVAHPSVAVEVMPHGIQRRHIEPATADALRREHLVVARLGSGQSNFGPGGLHIRMEATVRTIQLVRVVEDRLEPSDARLRDGFDKLTQAVQHFVRLLRQVKKHGGLL